MFERRIELESDESWWRRSGLQKAYELFYDLARMAETIGWGAAQRFFMSL